MSFELKIFGFSLNQRAEISKGKRFGLTREQINLYAKPEFNWQQMGEIRQGLEQGLSREQILVYANPKFDSEQMKVIRLGYESGLIYNNIKIYARPDVFDGKQMYEIFKGFDEMLSYSAWNSNRTKQRTDRILC